MLDGFIVDSAPSAHGDFIAFCPAHEDPGTSKSPSALINFTPNNPNSFPNGIISCFKCGFKGPNVNLDNAVEVYLGRVKAGVQFGRYVRKEHSRGFKTTMGKTQKLPSVRTRREFVKALLEDDEKLRSFRERRGLTEETIRKWRIGYIYTRNAYCYPAEKDGKVYAIRLYRPDSLDRKYSWYNSEGDRDPELMGIEELADEPVVIITEGEFDMMLARQDGLPALTHTAGAGRWDPAWSEWFRDKVVYVAYDADAAGRKGRVKVAQALKSVARAVYYIDYPNPDGKTGTDYTDYRIRDKFVKKDFEDLMEHAKVGGPETENKTWDGLPTSGKQITLAESMESKYIDEVVELTVQTLGRLDPAYGVPSKIEMFCTTDKGEKFCSVCPLQSGQLTLNIEKNSKFVAKVLNARDGEVDNLIIKESGAKCKDRITDIDRVATWEVEQISVGESVETIQHAEEGHLLSSKSDMTPAIYIIDPEKNSDVNEVYRIVGHTIPNPRDQRLIFMAWHREQTQTNLDQFHMTPEIMDDLKEFQPSATQSVFSKMRGIATDLAVNVAGVVSREELVMAYDIAWHSVLSFNFAGKTDKRGWVELLVFGDTRTGKSEAAERIANYYGCGKIFSSEGATRAGLVGAATQPPGSKHWLPSWGAIPQNDRRLIVLDEAQSLQDIVKDMGSIRSKGVAEMVKASINSSTSARTRLIWICNPVTQGKLDDFADGALTALAEFMPASEDRARFDLAIAVSSEDVDAKEIHRGRQRQMKTPKYSSEACNNLIMWAWSRQVNQIVIDRSVESHIFRKTEELIQLYKTAKSELVQDSNMHVKLARISVAIAARVFSTDETGELLIVKNSHVDAAFRIILDFYDNDALGLGRAARRSTKKSKQASGELGKIKKWLSGGKESSLPGVGIETYQALKRLPGRFKLDSFSLLSGLDINSAREVLGCLAAINVMDIEPSGLEMNVRQELRDMIAEMEEENDD